MASFGNFAGGFLQAFTAAKQNKEQNDRQSKLDKHIMALYQSQLEDANTRQAAIQSLASVATDPRRAAPQFANTAPEGELGSFVETGRKFGTGRMSIPEMLASSDPRLQQMIDQSGMREGMGAQAQSIATSRLAQTLRAAGQPVMADAIEAGASPAQLFTQESTRQPANLEILRAMGIEPASEEGRALLGAAMTGNTQADALRNMQLQLDLERTLQEMREDREAGLRGEIETRNSIEASISGVTEAARAVERLTGSLLETGNPLSAFARTGMPIVNTIQRMFGADTSESEALLADYDKLSKLTNQIIIDTLPALADAGTITNFKLEMYRDSMPNLELNPVANLYVLGELLDDVLKSAKLYGVEVEDQADLERLAEYLKTGPSAGSGDGAPEGVTPEEWENMTPEERALFQ